MNSKEYKIVKLKDISLGKGEYGIGAPSVPKSPNLPTYLRITDISDDGRLIKSGLTSVDNKDATNYLLNKNDIVFARTGASTGKSFYYEEKYGKLVYAGFLIKFTLDETKVNPKYLKYYTLSEEYKSWVKAFTGGSTRGNINAKTFGNMEIKLPSRAKQDYLVYILSFLDDKIETNNKINKNLEELAQTLYKNWFVDFEFPNENGKPYKSSGGKMVDSELGLIPKGWKVKEQGYYFPVVTGKKNVNFATPNGEYKFFTCSQQVFQAPSYSFDGTAILVAGNGDFNVKYYKGKFEAYQRTYVLIPFNDNLAGLFYFMIKENLNDITSGHRGSVIKFITKGDLDNYKIVMPEEEMLLRLSKHFTDIIQLIQKNNDENEKLTEIRDLLLPKLMSGEIKVPIEGE